MTTTEPTAQLAEDIAAWHDLERKRLEIVEAQDAIKTRIRQQCAAGKHETPSGTVSVTVNRRFDETLARTVVAAYNPQLLAEATKERVVVELDRDVLKRQLPPSTYEACMKEIGAPRVVIS